MKNFGHYIAFLALILLFSFVSGCVVWEPGWKQSRLRPDKADVKALMDNTMMSKDEAGARKKL